MRSVSQAISKLTEWPASARPCKASTIRDSLAEARKQATDMQGADLTLEDQEELIAILENELVKRRGTSAVNG